MPVSIRDNHTIANGGIAVCSIPLWIMVFSAAYSCWAEPNSETYSPFWQRLPDMPAAVIGPAASVVPGRLVVTGGLALSGSSTSAVQVLTLDQLRWTRPLQLVQPRFDHAQATLSDGRVFLCGGKGIDPDSRGFSLRSCEVINLDQGWVVQTQPLPVEMSSPTMHLLSDGQVLVIGNRQACVFDPVKESWTAMIDLHAVRHDHCSLGLEGDLVLVAGGVGVSSLEVINPTARSSVRLSAQLPFPLDDSALAHLPDGRVWIIGGQRLDGNTVNQTWVLDPGESSLSPGPSLPVPGGMSDHCVIELSTGIVVVGGETEFRGQDSELAVALWLDPHTLAVSRLPDTDVAHDDAAAVVLQGSVIVLGGLVKSSWMDLQIPTPVRAVHRLWVMGD